MDREDFWFRFRRSFHELFYGERTSVRLLSRLVLLTFVAGLVATVGPTVADVLTQNDPGPVSTYVEPTPELIGDTSTTTSPSPQASTGDTTTAQSPEPTPQYSVAPAKSDTATVEPIIEADAPLTKQPNYNLKVPETIGIDPRANSYFLPSIYLAGSKFTLVCVNGNGINFDISNKRISDDRSDTKTVMVLGDGSPNLRIAGRTAEVLSIINSDGGLFAFTNNGGLRDRNGSISVIATNKATIDSTFCGAASPGNSSSFTFRALGLQVDTKKASGRLK